MRSSLGEPLTVEDIARTALFSKFHFTRIFEQVTGVSPGRFLSAVRIQEAKRLLITTSLNVAEISHRVGYTSVGTFSTRFSRSVGVCPSKYRRMRGYAGVVEEPGGDPREPGGTVTGCVLRGPAEPYRRTRRSELTFLGLFSDRIPAGRPARCVVLAEPGQYRIDGVPEGRWHVLTHAVAAGPDEDHPAAEGLRVGACGPVTVRRGCCVTGADVRLNPARLTDPPVLLPMLDARWAIRRLGLQAASA
ncbi:helix-turn-helix transcriptional regulator [Dactylosporangium siamense]|nr:helix-turn-helix transcriptional regulator [Dactylosporangium siamense]